MENKTRKYPLFSACGLNCGLCPNFHIHTNGAFKCPGCAGEGFSQAHPKCGILNCCQRKGYEFCFECDEFHCSKYDSWGDSDSFITHRNFIPDMDKAKRLGIDVYNAEQTEKADILSTLLKSYNDGRRKTFFCLAVNLLELQDIKDVLIQVEKRIDAEAPLKEKAAAAVRLFEDMASQRGVVIKLRKEST